MGQPARKHPTKEFAAKLRLHAYTGEAIGDRTRLVQEALDQLLTPLVRDEVLTRAGWDDEHDRPLDRSMDLRQWVDTKLFPRLVDKTTLTAADELRRHVRALLKKTAPPPPMKAEVPASMESGTRRRPQFADPATLVPEAPGSSVLLWSHRPETARELQACLRNDVQLVAVADADELVSTLRVLGGRLSMVLMDRRADENDELRELSPDDLRGHRVVLWGPEQPNSLPYARVLGLAERTIGCSPEARLSDVADLCSAIVGAPRERAKSA